jgi:hypothetical protein
MVAGASAVRTSAGGEQGDKLFAQQLHRVADVPDFWPATEIAVDYDVL